MHGKRLLFRSMASILPSALLYHALSYVLPTHVGRLLCRRLALQFDHARIECILSGHGFATSRGPPPRAVVLRIVTRSPQLTMLGLSAQRWWGDAAVWRDGWLTDEEMHRIVAALPRLEELDVSFRFGVSAAGVAALRTKRVTAFGCWRVNIAPTPTLSPLDIVVSQIIAMRRDSVEGSTMGGAWAFAAPENKELFRNSLFAFRAAIYAGFPTMVQSSAAALREIVVTGDVSATAALHFRRGDTYMVLVKFKPLPRASDGTDSSARTFFQWYLRRQVEGPFAGCIMVDGVRTLSDSEWATGYAGELFRSGCRTKSQYDHENASARRPVGAARDRGSSIDADRMWDSTGVSSTPRMPLTSRSGSDRDSGVFVRAWAGPGEV